MSADTFDFLAQSLHSSAPSRKVYLPAVKMLTMHFLLLVDKDQAKDIENQITQYKEGCIFRAATLCGYIM